MLQQTARCLALAGKIVIGNFGACIAFVGRGVSLFAAANVFKSTLFANEFN